MIKEYSKAQDSQYQGRREMNLIPAHREILMSRPARAPMPRFASALGQFQWEYLIDYGSFRDMQRHRNNVCLMPLLNDRHKIAGWYLDQLPDAVRETTVAKLTSIIKQINELKLNSALSQYDAQYLYPMCMNVPYFLDMDLPQAIYLSELRSSKTVHPTMRRFAHNLATSSLQKRISYIQK
jgi:hypothetical protein